MKLIKAYIRTNMIDKVVQALESLGFTDMTVIDVKAVRRGIDPKTLDYSGGACRALHERGQAGDRIAG